MHLKSLVKGIPNLWKHSQIHLVHDGYDWVLHEIAKSLSGALTEKQLARVSTGISPHFLKQTLIHFISGTPQQTSISNKTVMTWYHVAPKDARLTQLSIIASTLDLLHTPSQLTKTTLIDAGFPSEKIVVLPAGVNLQAFTTTSCENKQAIRHSLGIPDGVFVIGSFQKDGSGWGNGMEPKQIKGPDIFCDVVERISSSYPLFVLLSGPSRGYVKQRLSDAGIPFKHQYLKKYEDVSMLYHACDAYLIASRIEGIPMALLEAWATGIPLVSTRVGMVNDVASDKETALLADVEDRDKLAENIAQLIDNSPLRESLIQKSLREVNVFDWPALIPRYWDKLYLPLLKTLL